MGDQDVTPALTVVDAATACATAHRYSMPSGAELMSDGSARFRLWAPGARSVELRLRRQGATERGIAMTPNADGWYAVSAPASAGDRYRYRINDDIDVPDPASRFQPDDVHGASEIIDPAAFVWNDAFWRGRAWEEAVIYELHVGTFSPTGDYAGVQTRLSYLRDLGVTAIELMPLADFPGRRSWGYDGVLPYAPDSRYGRPEQLKALIQAAHALGIMVLLDVVYNHFGPDGNYLPLYAVPFFTSRHQTPWGTAINFDDERSRVVRDFYIHNARYWLEEYRFDGLRFDAVHAIMDDSVPDIMTELAQTVAAHVGTKRQIHLILENDNNEARYLACDATGRPRSYTAQWNDDVHHALHVIGTGESNGYYADYSNAPLAHLGRCLVAGYAYQGEPSRLRHGAPRGEPTTGVPLTAFISFLQNHDQIGNRAYGERIAQLVRPEQLRALSAIFLLAPAPPMLFMGQEWGARQPFPYFCDFHDALADAVRDGRRKEFAHFPEFSDPHARERIPDPNAEQTFQSAVLNWDDAEREDGRHWRAWHAEVLRIRRRDIVPRLRQLVSPAGQYQVIGTHGLMVEIGFLDGARLRLLANLGDERINDIPRASGRVIYPYDDPNILASFMVDGLPPWSVVWLLDIPNA